MSTQPDYIGDDGPDFREGLKADKNTVLSRQWASDLFASFAAVKSAVWEFYGARLRECFGDDAAKIFAEAFDSARALVDASGRDDSESLRIRFACPSWMAQQFKARALFPKGADDEERKKIRARLERRWGRTGWPPLHQVQCATGLPFFRRNVKLFDANREREAAVYENEFTDLLLDVRRRARAFRRKHTVWRYEQAARETLRAYVSREDFRPYAPDWQPEPPDAPAAAPADEAEDEEPTVKVESIAIRAAARAAKIASQLPDEESDACALLFFERMAETWEAETGRVFPYVPPVIRRGDTEFSADMAADTSGTSGADGVVEFPAKNALSDTATADNLSPVEVVEFEPAEEPREVSEADAFAAATACRSVGIETVKVVFIDDTKPKGARDACTLAQELSAEEFQRRLPEYLERNRRSGNESFTVRLRRKEDTRLIQLDDCPREVMEGLSDLAFLIHATSPGNYQVWIALADDLTQEHYDELRYRLLTFLKPTGANGGAYGSTRWPGSLNNKPKRRYADGEPPRVALVRAGLGRRVSVAELEAAGILAPPRPKPTEREVREIRSRMVARDDWPDMDKYLSECDGDRSRAESKWCVRALYMGHSQTDVEVELERIGRKASVRRRDGYVRETVEKAARYVGLNPRSTPARRPEPSRAARPTPARERGEL